METTNSSRTATVFKPCSIKRLRWTQTALKMSNPFKFDIAEKLKIHTLVCSHMGSEILTTVCIRILLFWDMMPCSFGNDCKCLRGIFGLHFQSKRRMEAYGCPETLIAIYKNASYQIPSCSQCVLMCRQAPSSVGWNVLEALSLPSCESA